MNIVKTKKACLSVSALALLAEALWSAPALAQENAAQPAEKPTEIYLEEIIVSARKRDERLQDTPVSVSVFTERAIEDAGIEHPSDFVALTPNVHIADSQDPSNVAIQVRGIGQIRNGEAPVAIVVDGVILPSALNIDQELVDVRQIEVLKGPQGALYGRNAIAGAINIRTREPSNEFTGKVIAGYGNGQHWRFAGSVGGPLIEDKLLFRVTASHRQADGWIFNPTLERNVDFVNEEGMAARLKWLPTDNLTVDFRFSYSSNDSGTGYFALASVNNGQPGQPQITTIEEQANTVVPPRGNHLGRANKDAFDYAVRVDWDTDLGTFTSISALSKLDQIATFDGPDYSDNTQCTSFAVPFFKVADCPPGVAPNYFGATEFWNNFQDYDLNTFSQEIRFTSPSDSTLRYIVGAYYLDTDRQLDTVNNFDAGNAGFQISQIILDPNVPFRTRNFFSEVNNNEAFAVFGQVNYDVTEKLELSLSARYDRDKRQQRDPRPDAFRADGNGVPIAQDIPRERSETFDSFQPKITLRYAATDALSLYATYAEGFRSGGFNAPGSEAIAPNIYDSEESQNYEVGFKSQWLDKRLTLNGALFYSDYDNLQVFNFFGEVGLQLVTALDRVRSVGGELELNWYVTDGLQVYGGIGVADTEIKESRANPAAVGNEVPYNTRFSSFLGAQYVARISDALSAVFRVDWEHRGETPFHEGGHFSGIPVRDPLNLINARVSLDIYDDWRVTVWGRNLTDVKYYEETVVADFAFQARPRTYGIEVGKRF